MNNNINKFHAVLTTIIVFSILTSCASVQKKASYEEEVYPLIVEQKIPSYEEDVYPYIVEQIRNTATTFFYKDKENENVVNFVVGDNEIAGICQDYVSHFIENYKGPGEVFFLSITKEGIAQLEKKVKPFEKSDIVIKELNGGYNDDDYFKEIVENKTDYIYNDIIQTSKNIKNRFERWYFYYSSYYWSSNPIHIHIKDGTPFLVEVTPIPTPESHAGKTTENEFINHGWVRIKWNGMTIDVEPTWVDGGFSLEEVIEVI